MCTRGICWWCILENIRNSSDLYDKVVPALKCKKEELIRFGFKLINENDIWNSLLEHKWKKESKIALCDIVDDILNFSNDQLYEYIREDRKLASVIDLPKLKEE